MNLHIGADTAKQIYMGNTPASKIYRGATQIFETQSPPEITIAVANKIYEGVAVEFVTSKQTPLSGDSFTYTWNIVNNSTDTLYNLKVVSDYPNNISITRTTPLNQTQLLTNIDNITWIIPSIDPYYSAVVVFNATATSNDNSYNPPTVVFHNDIWNATLTVNTIASSYQWQQSTDGGISWSNINNTINNTLQLTDLTSVDAGKQYRVITINNGITTISQTGTLAL